MGSGGDEASSAGRRTFSVVLCGFCAFLTLFATQPLLPELAQIFNASKVRVSLTVTLGTLGVAITAPVIGAIADRFGRKRVIVWSAFLLAVSTALAATATSLGALLVWRFVQGIFTPGVFAITVAYIQEEWVGAGRGAATAAYVSGTVVGGFISRFLSGWIAAHSRWEMSFVALGLLGLIASGGIAALLPRERRFIRGDRGRREAAQDHLTNSSLVATYTIGFGLLFSMLGAFTYVTFYLAADPFRLSPASLGSLFFVYLFGAVITPNVGQVIDKYGERKTIMFAGAVGLIGTLATLSHNLWVVVFGLACICTGVFVSQSCTNSFIGTAARHSKALAVGLYVTFYYVGGTLGSSLPGFLWSIGGWPACVALFAAVQAGIIGVATIYWTDAHQHAETVALPITPD